MADASERRILEKLDDVQGDVIRLEGKVDTIKEYYAKREDVTEAIRCHERDRHGSGTFKRPKPSQWDDVSPLVKIGAIIGTSIAALLAGSQLPF